MYGYSCGVMLLSRDQCTISLSGDNSTRDNMIALLVTIVLAVLFSIVVITVIAVIAGITISE